MGHVTARHSVSQQSKQQLGQLLLVGGMIAAPKYAQYAEYAMAGMQLLFLKFSREPLCTGLAVKSERGSVSDPSSVPAHWLMPLPFTVSNRIKGRSSPCSTTWSLPTRYSLAG
jgi:hypothetical protein